MLIEDRYFIPDGLYEAVGAIADRQRRTQHVAMMYHADPRVPAGMEKLSLMWVDLKTGRNCAWVFGPKREELIAMRPAMILWIPPETQRERVIREEEAQQEIDDNSWYGVGA